MDVPSEAVALPARAGGSGRPPPSTSYPDRRGAVPASLLSAGGAGARAFPNFSARTEGLQGGPGQEEIISFHTNGLAIGVEKLNVWKSWKNQCLEDLEESLFSLWHPATIPVHCIYLSLSLFWNCQSSQFLLHTPGPI